MPIENIRSALTKTIKGVQDNAKLGRVVFRADTQLVEDVHCRAVVRNFPPFEIDEPADLGGSDKGPNPVELLLVALGTCQEVMFGAYAAMMGIQLHHVQVKLRGYLDLSGLLAINDAIPAGYQRITYETNIQSSAESEELEKLVAMVESHCPVLDSLTRAVTVEGKVRINGHELMRQQQAAV